MATASGQTHAEEASEAVIEALSEVEEAGEATEKVGREIAGRARTLRHAAENGEPIPAVIANEPRPRLVEMISSLLLALGGAGAKLRRAGALSLRTNGAKTHEIAGLFGVSHQRISRILRKPAGARDGQEQNGKEGSARDGLAADGALARDPDQV